MDGGALMRLTQEKCRLIIDQITQLKDKT
jgi:hypothetical protein